MKLAPILGLVAASLFAVSQAQAQHTFEQWNGGSGTWDAGTTTDWNGGQAYNNSISRDGTVSPEVSYAYFGSAPGTVTVDNSTSATPVTFGQMEFNSGGQTGNWVIQGDALSDIASDNTATVMTVDSGQTANVTFTGTINIAPNPTNGNSLFVNNSTSAILTVGNINISTTPITFTDSSGPHIAEPGPVTYNGNVITTQTADLYATNGATIVINGNYTTDSGLFGNLLIGNYGDSSMATGTYIFKGALDENINGGKQFDFGSGNIIFDTSNTGTGPMTFVGAGANLLQTLYTGGAYTINNFIANQGASNAQIGGSTADISTYNGGMNAGGSDGELTLHAAAGGRVIFNGTISGDNGATGSNGAGTVVLNQAAGNSYTSYSATVFDVTSGTLLITNTSNSAFGTTSGTVNVESAARLGGTGISTQQVIAEAPGSIIAPGDAGQTNLSIAASIGTLHLTGGLSAPTGVTLAFKLNGAAHDALDLGAGAFSISGPVTVNFTDLGVDSVLPGTDYVLATGSGLWSDAGATFDINAPDGLYVQSYDFNTSSDTFDVEFKVAPEPSTWALMGLGVLALSWRVRRRSATA